jgi:hypothetical protein
VFAFIIVKEIISAYLLSLNYFVTGGQKDVPVILVLEKN